MDKKTKKKSVIKRKSDESTDSEKKPKTMVNRNKTEEKVDKIEVVNQVVEVSSEQSPQIVHTGQIVEGNFEQPVFVNMKGEPVQLGPNTVILYEQNGNPSNFAFGGMWTMDPSGRIVMAEQIYDVKGEPEDENSGFVHNTTEVNTTVEESTSTFQQFEINTNTQVAQTQEYEVSIIDETTEDQSRSDRSESEDNIITTEEQLVAVGPNAVRWLNQKYDFVVRKLQMNYDAGVKLLHSPSGVTQCVYLTTPGMQLAFNSVPQFLCIETGLEFYSVCTPVNNHNQGPEYMIKHNVTLFLAEDGNGKSVIVSAGISTLIGEELTWLLDTFKSCNPAWRMVRCVVCDPSKSQEAVCAAFPAAHVTTSVYQAARATSKLLRPLTNGVLDPAASKTYALALLRGDHSMSQLFVLKRGIIGTGPSTVRLWDQVIRPGGPIHKLESWLEPENYTNILHKGLERVVNKLSVVMRKKMQPEEFVSVFFNVAHHLEEDRRSYALTRLRETEALKQSPTDTITQYAYNLMSHQTKLAQKCLDDKVGRIQSSAAIAKYGTSTQECSCLFSKVFRLPCRHILMLTTELKVKTHIPFEPRWTVQHCLFGCENNANTNTNNTTGNPQFIEQVVVEDNQNRGNTQQIHQVSAVRPQQYVIAAPGQTGTPVSQVIFCGNSVGTVGNTPVLTSVLPAGGAVLTPHTTHHTIHHA